jgi:hypothetical protein
MQEAVLTLILPPKHRRGDTGSVTLRVPRPMLRELEAEASHSGYTRTEVVLHLLRYGLDALAKERAEQRSTDEKKRK